MDENPTAPDPRIICRELGGEMMLYDPRGEAVHMLNPAAVTIWRLCVEGPTSGAPAGGR